MSRSWGCVTGECVILPGAGGPDKLIREINLEGGAEYWLTNDTSLPHVCAGLCG